MFVPESSTMPDPILVTLPEPLIVPLKMMLEVPSAARLADLLSVTPPPNVPVPEVMLPPSVVVPVPALATVTLRPMVTPDAPISRAVAFAPVLALLIVTADVALPRAPAEPLGASASIRSVPWLTVVVPVKVLAPASAQVPVPVLSSDPVPEITPVMLPIPVLDPAKVRVRVPRETVFEKRRPPADAAVHVWLAPRASALTLNCWSVALEFVMPAAVATVSVWNPVISYAFVVPLVNVIAPIEVAE